MPRNIAIGFIFLTVAVVISQQVSRLVEPAAAASTGTPASVTQAMHALEDSSNNLVELTRLHEQMVQINEQQAKIYSALSERINSVSKLAAQKSTSLGELSQAVKNMQETQMSYNLQYLQLQNAMQNENRQYTMVSNIMKTKNDTVKNSISNIR
jgi:L-cysteine desulfidase